MLMVLKLGLGLLRSRGSAIWLLSEIKKWKMNKWIIGPLCSSKHLLDAKYDEFFSFAKFLWQSLSTLWSLKAKRANLILDPELAWQKVQRGKYPGHQWGKHWSQGLISRKTGGIRRLGKIGGINHCKSPVTGKRWFSSCGKNRYKKWQMNGFCSEKRDIRKGRLLFFFLIEGIWKWGVIKERQVSIRKMSKTEVSYSAVVTVAR